MINGFFCICWDRLGRGKVGWGTRGRDRRGLRRYDESYGDG